MSSELVARLFRSVGGRCVVCGRYRAAVALRPDMSVLNFNLAQALEARQADAQASVNRSPDADAVDQIADRTGEQGATEDIEQLHLQAIRLNPNATSSLCALVLGRLYVCASACRRRHRTQSECEHSLVRRRRVVWVIFALPPGWCAGILWIGVNVTSCCREFV